MIGRHSWWWVLAGIFFACSAGLGFLYGTVFAEEWNAANASVAAERGEIQQACIDGNDRACRVYEVRYGR